MNKVTYSKLDKFQNTSLTQVVFVHDYIQLIFQDYCITAYNPISIKKSNKIYRRSELLFCNELISLIGNVVQKVFFEKKYCKILFENIEISISLQDSDYIGPEAINIQIDNDLIVE